MGEPTREADWAARSRPDAEVAPKDPDAPGPEIKTRADSRATDESVARRNERFELYKLAVEMADRVSARRTGANNFFLALHAAFASILTFFGFQASGPAGDGSMSTPADHLGIVVIAIVGVLLCGAWFLGLRSYRDLNTAKFKVINALEPDLPVQLFSQEWQYLKDDAIQGWRGRYREQGTVEQVVPVLFGIVYVIAATLVVLR